MFFLGSVGEICTVFDEESESEVENLEILHPDLEIKENPQKTLKIWGSLIRGGSG